jgi:site-specific recombinase XerD
LANGYNDWLIKQRGLSAHTIRSYRDTWKLFLRFAADRHHRPVPKLRFEDLTAPQVVDFLEQQDRKVTVGTRNCRLAALRSFYSFVASPEPLAIAQCTAVLHTPTKRAATRAPTYLEPQEIELILSAIKTDTAEGQRDHALLNFLYNTGARHAAAVSLVSSGADVTVIRSWLGHASLDTTNLYAQANIATKRDALERLEPPFSRRPRWKRESGLIEWLESL